MVLNGKKRIIVSLVDSVFIPERLEQINANPETDVMLVTYSHIRRIKDCFASLFPFGTTRGKVSVFSLGLLWALIKCRPTHIVFLLNFHSSNLNIFKDIYRLTCLLGFKVTLGVNIDNTVRYFNANSTFFYQNTQSNSFLDKMYLYLLLFCIACISLINFNAGLLFCGLLVFILCVKIIYATFFLKNSNDTTYRRVNYRIFSEFVERYSFRNTSEKGLDSNIFWFDRSNVEEVRYYSPLFDNDVINCFSSYKVTNQGYRQILSNYDSTEGEIAITGGSLSFGSFVQDGLVASDILQKKLPEHKFINASISEGVSTVSLYKNLDRFLINNPKLNTLVFFLSRF